MHSFIHWSFCSEPSRYCLSQTVGAGQLTFWENVHPPPNVTCRVSHVRCQVSGVICHVSCVRCQVSGVRCHFVGGASRWRFCYQRGLPHLVFHKGWRKELMSDKGVCRTAAATPRLKTKQGRPLLITDPPPNSFTTL